jgi:ankyrin repeat protein
MTAPRPPSHPPPRLVVETLAIGEVKSTSSSAEKKKKSMRKADKREAKDLRRLRKENEELKRQLIDREQTIMRLKSVHYKETMGLGDPVMDKDKMSSQGDRRPVSPIMGGALPRPKSSLKMSSVKNESMVEGKTRDKENMRCVSIDNNGKSKSEENDPEKRQEEEQKTPSRKRPSPLVIEDMNILGVRDEYQVCDLLDGTKMLWRFPFNCRGVPQKRFVYLGLEESVGHLREDYKKCVKFVSISELLNGVGVNNSGSCTKNKYSLRDPPTICWRDPSSMMAKKDERQLQLGRDTRLMVGHCTPVFRKMLQKAGPANMPRPEVCFSLVTPARSLDLAASSRAEADAWVAALQQVLPLLVNLEKCVHIPIPQKAISSHLHSSLSSSMPPTSVYQEPLSIYGEQVIASPSASPMFAAGGEANPLICQPPSSGTSTVTSEGPFFPGMMDDGRSAQVTPIHATAGVRFLSENSITVSANRDGGGTRHTLGGSSEAEVRRKSWKERLFSAAYEGDAELLTAVLDGGAPVDTPLRDPDIQSSSLLAASKGSISNIDTPMLICARLGHVNCVRICLEHGARNDPHAEGTTALHSAVDKNQYESAELLLETAAKSSDGANAVICALTDYRGLTPLHIASGKGDTKMVELLLHHGARPSARTVPPSLHSYTSLHSAVEGGREEVMAVLLDYDDDLEALDLIDRLEGDTALHLAVKENKIGCVRLLLQSAANPLLRDNNGMKALDTAIKKGFTNLGVLLLEYETSLKNPTPGTVPLAVIHDIAMRERDEEKDSVTERDESEGVVAVEEDERKEHVSEEPIEKFFFDSELYFVFFSVSDGIHYYHNTVSGESIWDDPRELHEVKVTTPDPD